MLNPTYTNLIFALKFDCETVLKLWQWVKKIIKNWEWNFCCCWIMKTSSQSLHKSNFYGYSSSIEGKEWAGVELVANWCGIFFTYAKMREKEKKKKSVQKWVKLIWMQN